MKKLHQKITMITINREEEEENDSDDPEEIQRRIKRI